MPESTAATARYSTVQTTSDAMMPIGRSRLRILRFLRRGRDGVEADVGEEHDRGAAAMMPDQPYGANGDQFSGRTNVAPAPMKNTTAISLIATMTALARADSRTPITSSTMITSTISDGQQVDDADRRRRGQRRGQRDADARQQALHVTAPADGHGHRADGVFENQVPADHPRHQFAERRIGVGVGAAGDRNHRRELGVAERRKGARQACRQIRHRDRRAGLVRRRRPGQHENAGADDGADAQQRQVPRGEAALERLAAVLGIADELLDRLRLEQIRIHSPSGVRYTRSPRVPIDRPPPD